MPEVITPSDEWGNNLVPFEAETRVALPIYTEQEGATNKHHAHFFRTVFEAGPEGTQSVRFSRLQRVPLAAHNRYHREFHGALLPQSRFEEFSVTVLNQSGYLPGSVVNMDSGEIEEMTPKMRRRLIEPNTFTTESGKRAKIGSFLMTYAIAQDFDISGQNDVDIFLEITEEDMKYNELKRALKLKIGKRLVGKAIEAAVTPINPTFSTARKNKQFKIDAPRSAWRAVRRYVSGYEQDYIPALHKRVEQLKQAA